MLMIKPLTIKEYLERSKPYLIDIINNLKISGTWKTQLAIAISFMCSKDPDEKRVMHSKSDNIEKITIDKEADEFIKERFESLFPRYQISLEEPMILSLIVLSYCTENVIK